MYNIHTNIIDLNIMNTDPSKSTPTAENIDEYEREKIERTISDLESAADALRRYVALADQLADNDVKLSMHEGHDCLDNLRYPGGLAGPDSDLWKLFKRAEATSFRAQHIAQASGIDIDTQKPFVQETERRVVRGKVTDILKTFDSDPLKEVRLEELRRATAS